MAAALETYIALFLLLILLALVGLLLRREARLEARLESLREEVRYDIPPARRAAIEGSILAVLRGSSEAGVAFFVSPTTALTAAHNLRAGGAASRFAKTAACVRPDSGGARLVFDVVALEAALDFAVLRLRAGQPPSPHFLELPAAGGFASTPGDKGVFLVTCNIHVAAEAPEPEAATVGVAWHHARVVRFHPQHVLYDAHAFDGDSGGALVIARSGVVIGLHRELVNAARELLEHKGSAGERLNAVEQSVQSLIRGTTFGCIGVRLDCAAAQAALLGGGAR